MNFIQIDQSINILKTWVLNCSNSQICGLEFSSQIIYKHTTTPSSHATHARNLRLPVTSVRMRKVGRSLEILTKLPTFLQIRLLSSSKDAKTQSMKRNLIRISTFYFGTSTWPFWKLPKRDVEAHAFISNEFSWECYQRDAVLVQDLLLPVSVSDPVRFMIGMFSAMTAAAIWLFIATAFKLPVSSTHCIVGAVIGFGVVATGVSALRQSYRVIVNILISWIASPIIGGLIAFSMLTFIQRCVLSVFFSFWVDTVLVCTQSKERTPHRLRCRCNKRSQTPRPLYILNVCRRVCLFQRGACSLYRMLTCSLFFEFRVGFVLLGCSRYLCPFSCV